jgi:hypothetical protein
MGFRASPLRVRGQLIWPRGSTSDHRQACRSVADNVADLAKRIRRDAEADEDGSADGNGVNGKGKGRAAIVEDEEQDETAYARGECTARQYCHLPTPVSSS